MMRETIFENQRNFRKHHFLTLQNKYILKTSLLQEDLGINIPNSFKTQSFEDFRNSDQKNLFGFLGPRKSIDFRGNQGFSDFLFLTKSKKIKK